MKLSRRAVPAAEKERQAVAMCGLPQMKTNECLTKEQE